MHSQKHLIAEINTKNKQMKYILPLIFIIVFNLNSFSQKFVLFKGDTINRVDKNNLKQGLWIYFNDNYKNKIYQKGYYKDGKKEGSWYTYYKNGNLNSEMEFKNNRQNGKVSIYYKNGKLQEQGYWKQNRWVGEYKFFFNSGKIKYLWYYDDFGKRTGKQTYYYANGKKQIEGQWTQGKESGKITEYFKNGKVEKVSNFDNGTLNGAVTEYYSDGQIKSRSVYMNGQADINQSFAYSHKNNTSNNNDNIANNSTTTKNTDPEYKVFSGNGYYKFVNEKGLIDREGTFSKGILINGKKYIYDDNGKKIKTAIIKNGRVIRVIKNDKNK